MTDLPGLDLDRLGTYLEDSVPGLVGGPLTGSVIPGGRSNLTYDVTDGETHVVVRRPPLGHVLATAHDMRREFTVINALGSTNVPVPHAYVLCEDTDVIGSPFYVMSKAEGRALRRAGELEELGPERTADIAGLLIDTLADLHAVDPASVGLEEFGRPQGYLERQVRRWTKQAEASKSRDLAGYEELRDFLGTHVPTHSDATIVHGDYRLDNVLVDTSPDGKDAITAVLDWEMATLGDPLSDIALTIVYQEMGRSTRNNAVADATAAPGYPTVDEVLERYSSRSGRDVSTMGFHLALGYFKLAVITEGIHYRYTQGQTVGDGFSRMGAATEPLIAAGLASART
ncbi:phosphotransferase family protein [Mumia sp. zg.B17]|uniref:phosphotransferase family protein n=1 Tax=unclassified Mumia TaxID=2621872 RepID=UPI001C6E9332|nr:MULTISPECIES: phosphotransferase family protein [unclassified Mumia]MBW9205704.1 phosphotransferase family protein [Mumia sp. zg.B17]MDD9350275.1 phosphotransferase family protein [Mumia sp.]